jgi:hypothetical protein
MNRPVASKVGPGFSPDIKPSQAMGFSPQGMPSPFPTIQTAVTLTAQHTH